MSSFYTYYAQSVHAIHVTMYFIKLCTIGHLSDDVILHHTCVLYLSCAFSELDMHVTYGTCLIICQHKYCTIGWLVSSRLGLLNIFWTYHILHRICLRSHPS